MPNKTMTCPCCKSSDIEREDASYMNKDSSYKCVATNYYCNECEAEWRWEKGRSLEITEEPDYAILAVAQLQDLIG